MYYALASGIWKLETRLLDHVLDLYNRTAALFFIVGRGRIFPR